MFYISIIQSDDFSSSINSDDKLNVLKGLPISRFRRRQHISSLTSIEKSSFISVDSSLAWLGISTSPLYAFKAIHLQQQLPTAIVRILCSQINCLLSLKSFRSTISFPPAHDSGEFTLSIAVCSNDGLVDSHRQLSYLSGIIIEPLYEGAKFYTFSWSSHKSKRSVKSIGAAEMFSTSELIDKGKVQKTVQSTFLSITVKLMAIVD